MKKSIAIFTSVCSLFLSPSIYAGAGWTDFVTVGELVSTAQHYYEVKLPVKDNPSGCKNKTWFYQDYSSPGSDKMYKTLLEGLKSGIRLRVYVSGNCNINGYSEFTSVSVIPD